jgi:hypothetical protein
MKEKSSISLLASLLVCAAACFVLLLLWEACAAVVACPVAAMCGDIRRLFSCLCCLSYLVATATKTVTFVECFILSESYKSTLILTFTAIRKS